MNLRAVERAKRFVGSALVQRGLEEVAQLDDLLGAARHLHGGYQKDSPCSAPIAAPDHFDLGLDSALVVGSDSGSETGLAVEFDSATEPVKRRAEGWQLDPAAVAFAAAGCVVGEPGCGIVGVVGDLLHSLARAVVYHRQPVGY